MGNCFGKESKSGNFKGSGNTIADYNARNTAPTKATVAPSATSGGGNRFISTPGRTLGGSDPSSEAGDARSAAAAAAEARANRAGAGTDKLSQQLAAQKKAGMKGALAEAAEENRRQRETDAMAEARNFQ